MKRNLVIAILAICALTGVAIYFNHSPVPPSVAPPKGDAQKPIVQQQARTEVPPAVPAPSAPTVIVPPPAIEPDFPATPEVATPTEDNQAVAALPLGPIPLPPPRPKLPASDEPQPELTLSQMHKGSPVFIRIFKRENVLELWTHHEGRFRFVKKYPICAWSGALGPKQTVGDYQSPEGFYEVTKKQLNPKSQYHRAFNVGFPNAYDTQLGRTGSALMVHGACASAGCYAMTNPAIAELYPIIETALNAGQKAIPVHIFPFRMTDAALRAQSQNQWYGFWTNLKTGYDSFEKSRTPPAAFACNGRYVLDRKEATRPGCQKITGWL